MVLDMQTHCWNSQCILKKHMILILITLLYFLITCVIVLQEVFLSSNGWDLNSIFLKEGFYDYDSSALT